MRLPGRAGRKNAHAEAQRTATIVIQTLALQGGFGRKDADGDLNFAAGNDEEIGAGGAVAFDAAIWERAMEFLGGLQRDMWSDGYVVKIGKPRQGKEPRIVDCGVAEAQGVQLVQFAQVVGG